MDDPNLDSPTHAGFHFRPASLRAGDHTRIIEMYDSQIPWLRRIGAGVMWSSKAGGNPQKEKGFYDVIAKCDEQSTGAGYSVSFGKDWSRAFIAEVQVPLNKDRNVKYLENALGSIEKYPKEYDSNGEVCLVTLPVAAMLVDGISSSYTRDVLPEQDSDAPFAFMNLLVADRRIEALAKGSGAALIKYVKQEVLPKIDGVKRFVGDCYSGNGGLLVKYYEKQGFHVIGHFVFKKKEGDWEGAVFEMQL